MALTAVVLFLFWAQSGLVAQAVGQRHGPYVRPYEVNDPRFCHLTPQPFLCRECLSRGQALAQVLTFDGEGRPHRSYRCVPLPGK